MTTHRFQPHPVQSAGRVLTALGAVASIVLVTHAGLAQEPGSVTRRPNLNRQAGYAVTVPPDPNSPAGRAAGIEVVARPGPGLAPMTGPMWPATPPYAPTQPWQGKFLPDGQPELPKGHWYTINNSTRYLDSDQPFGGLKGSRVVDPPTRKIPYQPWARELMKTQDYDLEHPTKPWHVDTTPRCLASVPRQMYYVSSYQIWQGPGVVVFDHELYHLSRVIALDGSPHIAPQIKLWMGDARGRWEGNTLIVDTTSLNGKSRLVAAGDFMSSNAHLTERMTFINDGYDMVYEATIDDPTVYTRPWTIRVGHILDPNVSKPGREPEGEFIEDACYEGLAEGVPSEIDATKVEMGPFKVY